MVSILYGIPQYSDFGPLILLKCISDLNQTEKFCKAYHFAHDGTLLRFNKSIVKLNKFVNPDMKNLSEWLNANHVSLNVQKTEMLSFKYRNVIDIDLKIKLSWQKLYPSLSVKIPWY